MTSLIEMKGGNRSKQRQGNGHLQGNGRGQAALAVCAVLLCYAMPLLARLPHGQESVLGAWLFSGEYAGGLYYRAASYSFLLFPSLPALVAFCAVKLARPRWYLTGWFGALAVLLVLFGCHYRSGGLQEDSLVYASVYLSAPIYAAFAGIAGAVLGAWVQDLLRQRDR